ncbi:DedA family protein [Candidatus Azambacteria bacterium]|nr:DedA family protein [Candidatus Azambacteria bacterium]
MLDNIFQSLSQFIISFIDAFGVYGVFFLMLLESVAIPIPSEVIVPFSGFLVFEGKMTFMEVFWAGVFGNMAGSIVLYYIGYFGGRPFLEKYGKYFLFTHEDLEKTERWFQKYGALTVSFSRMLPAVRTFISFVPGVAKMNIFKFIAYTFFGCIPWVYALTYAGVIAGDNWNILHPYFQKAEWVIIILVLVGSYWFVKKHLKKNL